MLRALGRQLLVLVIFAAPFCMVSDALALHQSDGVVRQLVLNNWAGPALPLWVYRPAAAGAEARVVFVMHGVHRDALRYLYEWTAYADRSRFIVVAPEFSERSFPGDQYALGGVVDAFGRVRPRSRWSLSAIEPAFDLVVSAEHLHTTHYAVYGHSAGAQFVHRFVLLHAGSRATRAIAANAGWYTMPLDRLRWPFGVAAVRAPIAAAFATPLIVLLGDADTNPFDENLSQSRGATAQGQTRFERGLRFYATARSVAADEALPLRWTCKIVQGMGHSNAEAASAASTLMFAPAAAPAGPCTTARMYWPQ